MPRQTITTAIDYPNAAPHMGHVLEKVLADACARWFRLRGDEVRFQIGLDEHGIKIQQTAQKAGLSPRELVDQHEPLFRGLYDALDVSYDVFVRTSDQAVHWPTVQALWRKLAATGALERRTYSGLYCTGCERFVTEKDLVDGKCPDHQRAPEAVSEENWFFLLSRHQAWLRQILTEGTYRIVPEHRAPETLALIDRGLEDVSFSRPRSSLSWGVPVPGEEETQTMYVWCDALTNYISTLGYLTDQADRRWWDEARVTHVIGKDIARFHALIWPAMLKAAEVRTPDQLLIHGFLTNEGQKMSKSLGNVVVPADALAKYGVDALRFYLLSEVPVGNDGDFSWTRFDEQYAAKLGNQLGNLLNRVMVLVGKSGGALAPLPSTDPLAQLVSETWSDYRSSADGLMVHEVVQAITQLVDRLNVAMQERQPWKLEGAEKLAVLSAFAEALRHVSLLLLPIMPRTAQRMAVQLGVPYAAQMLEKSFTLGSLTTWGACVDWHAVGTPEILFPKVEG
jgi:methionyl-tRNA synthetase